MTKKTDYQWNKITYIVKKYSTSLLRLAYSYTGNMYDSEDILQEVFIKLAKNGLLATEEQTKAWLIRVTINTSINLNKSAYKQKVKELDFDVPIEDEEKLDLTEYLCELPDKYKAALYLYYYEEYEISYIAKLLKKKVSSVYTLLDRGRKMLKEIIEREGGY